MRFAIGLATAGLVAATGVAMAVPSPQRAGRRVAVKPTHQLVMLKHATQVFSRPNRGSARVMIVSKKRPITGQQTVLPVIGRATDRHRAAWLRVLLPGRPNSHAGWFPRRSARPAVTGWQITVRISRRQVTARRHGRLVRTFKAVVGKPSTPTPLGRFFVEETVKLDKREVGAPYALALSARSNVLQEFAGGPGQIALHGTNHIGGIPGTAASHGCIRLDTRAITWLASRIGPGSLVTITR